jgi:transposase
MGGASLSDPPAPHPLGCRLLGPAPHQLDHATLRATAVIPWNPKRQKNRSCLPSTWTKDELGRRSAIERFFGRVFLFFHLQRPPLYGWSAIARQVALTYTASIIVGLAAQHAGRPELIRSRHSCPRSYLGGLLSEDTSSIS